MPKNKDYKKVAAKLQKELDQLKKQFKTQFQKGIDYAHVQMEKLHAAYDKHMVKADAEFHKKLKTKPAKKVATKKTATKKGPATKAAKTKKAVPAKPKVSTANKRKQAPKTVESKVEETKSE